MLNSADKLNKGNLNKAAQVLFALSFFGLSACGGEDPGFTGDQDKGDIFGSYGEGESCSNDITCDSEQNLICRPAAEGSLDSTCQTPGESFDPCESTDDCAIDFACLGQTRDIGFGTVAPGVCINAAYSEPQWQITVVSAEVNPGFSDKTPNPYAMMTSQQGNTVEVATSIVYTTYSPVWNESLSYLPEVFITTYAWDVQVLHAGFPLPEVIDSCTVSITHDNLLAGQMTIPACGNYVTNLQLSFALLERYN